MRDRCGSSAEVQPFELRSLMPSRRHFGTVRRRPSGRWQALYEYRGQMHAAGTFPTKADAQARLSEIEVDLKRGMWTDPRAGKIMLAAYSEEWLELRIGLATRTRELYSFLLSRYVNPGLGGLLMSEVSPSQVRKWHAELAGRLPSTAAKAYRLLSTIMKTAVADGVVATSPCRVVGASTERPDERPIATLEDVRRLHDLMPERLQIVVSLAAWCQLRRGEILGLRRCDVDLGSATVRIEQSRTFLMDGSFTVKAPKTRAGRRVIALPRLVRDELEEYIARYGDDDPEALLVTNAQGAPVSNMSVQRSWARARTAIGRSELHLHDLRHTGLTLAAAMGATTAELMHRAGHASPEAALRYQHATRDRDQLLADALDSLARGRDGRTRRRRT